VFILCNTYLGTGFDLWATGEQNWFIRYKSKVTTMHLAHEVINFWGKCRSRVQVNDILCIVYQKNK